MRLLMVDDEFYAIQGILDGVDWSLLAFEEILTANSYTQAIHIFSQKRIDILLCDIEMPYGSGIDLVKWVKEYHPQTECIFLTCHSEFDFARQAVEFQCLDYLLKPAVPGKIIEVFSRAIEAVEKKKKNARYEQYAKRYIEKISEMEPEEAGRKKNVIEKVRHYIQDHISEILTVEKIAQTFYISPDHLTRLFKKEYNMTIIEYITEQRMLLAKELLAENKLTVSMVSAKVGYNNYSHFTKMFKKYYGCPPREFQK